VFIAVVNYCVTKHVATECGQNSEGLNVTTCGVQTLCSPWKYQTLKDIPFIDLLKHRTAEIALLIVDIIRL